jgi:hypothetical protein
MSTARATGTLTITVVDSCAIAADVANAITIELDDDLNNEKTCFTPGERIYLRVYGTPTELSYAIRNTYGSIIANPGGSGLSEHEEYVTITEGSGSTQYPIHQMDSIAWHGDSPCPIGSVEYNVTVFSGGYKYLRCTEGSCSGSPDDNPEPDETGICDVTYGVLKVEYKSYYESFYAIADAAGRILVYAYED